MNTSLFLKNRTKLYISLGFILGTPALNANCVGGIDVIYQPPTIESNALLNNTHKGAYGYFNTPVGWYIVNINDIYDPSGQGKIYFLTKMFPDSAGRMQAGWGTLCGTTDSTPILDIAKTDFTKNRIAIRDDLSYCSFPSGGYHEAADSGKWVSDTGGYDTSKRAENIRGKIFNLEWYFFTATVGTGDVWYITPPQRTAKELDILRFDYEGTDYCWKRITSGTQWVPYLLPTTSTTRRVPRLPTPDIVLEDPKAPTPSPAVSSVTPITSGTDINQFPSSNEISSLTTDISKLVTPPPAGTEPVNKSSDPSKIVAKDCNSGRFTDASLFGSQADYIEALCSPSIVIGYLPEQQLDGKRPFKPAQIATYAETSKVLIYTNDYGVRHQCDQWANNNPSNWWKCAHDIVSTRVSNVPTDSDTVRAAGVTRGYATRVAAKLFFNYSAQNDNDAISYLNQKGLTFANFGNSTTPLTRADLVELAVKVAKAAGVQLPYGDIPSTNLNNNISDNSSKKDSLPLPTVPAFLTTSSSGNSVNVDIDALLLKVMGEKGKTGGLWTDLKTNTTYCAKFVRMMYDKSPHFPTAYDMCNFFNQKGKLNHGKPTNMPGSVVCYNKSSGNGDNGHVSIATYRNTEIGVTDVKAGVTEKNLGTVGNLMGYITPSDFANTYPK